MTSKCIYISVRREMVFICSECFRNGAIKWSYEKGKNTGRLFFIDSENVGDAWTALSDVAGYDDELLVFYTSNSPHMAYKNVLRLINTTAKITFIECCTGSNALDFQLLTELGFRVTGTKGQEFYIISNDSGFDAVVKYWRRRNLIIKRCPNIDSIAKKDISVEILTPPMSVASGQ